VLDNVPIATQEVAAELALECWHELAEDLMMPAWDFDDTYTEDADEESDTGDDDAFIDIDYRQGDLEEIDLMMIIDKDNGELAEIKEEWT
jgi:hypothetical protein